MHEDDWRVVEETRDEPYASKGFIITNVIRNLEARVLKFFMVNPLYDPRLTAPEYSVRRVPVDCDDALAAALEGLPWTPEERVRKVGARLEQTLVAAMGNVDVDPETGGGTAESEGENPDETRPTESAPGPDGDGVSAARASEASHGLWELSVERRHHPQFSEGMLRVVVRGLTSDTWDVALHSAGATWQLSRSSDTRRELVRHGAVSALQTLARRSIDAADGGGLRRETRARIQDFVAGCMGVLMVDKEARDALFAEHPSVPDLIALSSDNPRGDARGLEEAAAAVHAPHAKRFAAMASLAPMTKPTSATQTAAAEALLAALCRDGDVRQAFSRSRGLGSLVGLLESRVLRVQVAASHAVALYSTGAEEREALAMSGDASDLFSSLGESMEGAILGLHAKAAAAANVPGAEGEGGSRGHGGHAGHGMSRAQLSAMIGAQGSGLWACALATHMNDAVSMDAETSRRLMVLAVLALEVGGISRAQTCLAGVFACLALDAEEAERMMADNSVQAPPQGCVIETATEEEDGKREMEDDADPEDDGAEKEDGKDAEDGLAAYFKTAPTGLPSSQGWMLNRALSGDAPLDASITGPRRALSMMLRFVPNHGGAAWVRAHAAAAVGNLASHPKGARGEAALTGTFRRQLIEAGMFEDILAAVSRASPDPEADARCFEAASATLMLLAGEGHEVTPGTMSTLMDLVEREAGAVRSQQFLMATLWLLMRDPANRKCARGVMIPADEAEEAVKARARAEARAAAREERARARAAKAEAARRAEEAGEMPPPPEDDDGGEDEEEEEATAAGFAPAPGRQRLLAVLTLVAEKNIDVFAAAGAGTDDSFPVRPYAGDPEAGLGRGTSKKPAEVHLDAPEDTDEGEDAQPPAETADDKPPTDGAAADDPLKQWMFRHDQARLDPAVMTFAWWVGTLWLFMYDPTDELLKPREDVFEFDGNTWWTVPAAESSTLFDSAMPRPGSDGQKSPRGSSSARPEMSGAVLGVLARLAEPRRRCHHKVQELSVGLMWNLAARDATLAHRMVAGQVPELCGAICRDATLPPPLREKALGLLQCLFEGSTLSNVDAPRVRVLLVDAAVALVDRGAEWAWKDAKSGMATGGDVELDDGYAGAGDDPFALELAAMRALTRVTAEPGAKELCMERGALDCAVAVLAAGYYAKHWDRPLGGAPVTEAGASLEGDAPVAPPVGPGMLPMAMMRSDAVREAAAVCLRNMSSCQPLMGPIGRRALYLLLNVNLDRRRRRAERVHAATVLHNIHKEPSNRTRFYKAELRYKSLGAVRKGRSKEAPRAPRTDPLPFTPSAVSAEMSAMSSSGLNAFWLSGYGSDGYGSDGLGGSRGEGEGDENKGDDEVPDVLSLDTELKFAPRPHEQMAGDMMLWMQRQFPPRQRRTDGWRRLTVQDDPLRLPRRGGSEWRPGSPPNGNLSGTFLPSIDAESTSGSTQTRFRGEDERKPKHRFKRSMCRPVDKIWGAVPGEGDGVPGTGGLRKGNLRWGPVVHEYVTTDAKCLLTSGSADLLTARRPGSTARRLTEAADQVASAAAVDHLGINGGVNPRPATALPQRPTHPLNPAMGGEEQTPPLAVIGDVSTRRRNAQGRGETETATASVPRRAVAASRSTTRRVSTAQPRGRRGQPPAADILEGGGERERPPSGVGEDRGRTSGGRASTAGGGVRRERSKGCTSVSDGSGYHEPKLPLGPTRGSTSARARPASSAMGSRSIRSAASARIGARAGSARKLPDFDGDTLGGKRYLEASFLESFGWHDTKRVEAPAARRGGRERRLPSSPRVAADAVQSDGVEAKPLVGDAADWEWGESGPGPNIHATPNDGDLADDRVQALQLVLEQPGSSRHRITFEDKPQNAVKLKQGKALRFMAWKKVEGSKVHDDLPSYQLPNGLRGHFYDRGSEFIEEFTLHAAVPPDQPVDLKGLLQSDMPPRTVLIDLSTPSDFGGLAAIRPTPRLPPDPDRHTLDVAQPPRFFGDLEQRLPLIEAEVELVHKEETGEERCALEESPPWDIDKSVFAPRRRASDGKDYYNNAKVQALQFEMDWKRLISKERFTGFVERESIKAAVEDCMPKPKKGAEIESIKECLRVNFHALSRCFIYYSLLGNGDIFSMQLNEYSDFLDSCNIPDPESESCKRSHCDTLFITANYEETRDDDNDNTALMRFEFLEVIVRLAVMKFGGGQAETWNLSDNVNRLITRLILPSMPPMAMQDEDEYRRNRLYCDEMDVLYNKHLDLIRALYSRYRLPPREGGVRAKLINLDDWMELFENVKLVDDFFTLRDLKCCFVFARMTAIDEYNTRKNEQLMFVDFLDALGRVAELVNLPIQREVEKLGHANIMEYHDTVLVEGDDNRAPWRESTEFEKPKTRRLSLKTEMLLELIFRRLDVDPSAATDKPAEGQEYEFNHDNLLKRLKAIDKQLGP